MFAAAVCGHFDRYQRFDDHGGEYWPQRINIPSRITIIITIATLVCCQHIPQIHHYHYYHQHQHQHHLRHISLSHRRASPSYHPSTSNLHFVSFSITETHTCIRFVFIFISFSIYIPRNECYFSFICCLPCFNASEVCEFQQYSRLIFPFFSRPCRKP